MNYQQTHFILSAKTRKEMPKDEGAEIAFIGRSNSGKSSVINCVCAQKKLVRTSKTPGQTQMINVFEVAPCYRLIDLPGYGFAKVDAGVRRHWEIHLDDYLRNRQSLKGLILVMDIRHPFSEDDLAWLHWTENIEMPTHVLLNKQDKLTYSAAHRTFLEAKAQMQWNEHRSIQLFSAKTGEGLKGLHSVLNLWMSSDFL